jgi:transcriptional regulator with XRE-family HTH domain
MDYIGSTIREKSLELRELGLSYSEISKQLNVPKSTLSGWLKDLPLSKIAKKKNIEKGKIISARNIIEFNKKRAVAYKKRVSASLLAHSKSLPPIKKDQLFWLGIALFLAEGGKRERWSVRFVNSDPLAIRIMMDFFRKICNVRDDSFKFRIHLHKNTNPAQSLKFWSEVASISEEQFYRPYFAVPKSSGGKRPINRLQYGTLHIMISDTELVMKLRGWIMGLQKQFEIK